MTATRLLRTSPQALAPKPRILFYLIALEPALTPSGDVGAPAGAQGAAIISWTTPTAGYFVQWEGEYGYFAVKAEDEGVKWQRVTVPVRAKAKVN